LSEKKLTTTTVLNYFSSVFIKKKQIFHKNVCLLVQVAGEVTKLSRAVLRKLLLIYVYFI